MVLASPLGCPLSAEEVQTRQNTAPKAEFRAEKQLLRCAIQLKEAALGFPKGLLYARLFGSFWDQANVSLDFDAEN